MKIATEEQFISIKNIQNGDLIFVGAQTEELSGAISRVTKLSDQTNFDHVGLIEKTSDSIFVLHAAPMGGSQREEIHHFYTSQTEKNNQIVIYRLKKEYQSTIPHAIEKAKTMLGKPYNWLYILNDNELYCSDFVERAFRDDKVFELIPMNFKNKETGIIDNFWVDFYRKKGKEVPQDEPGTNPNQLATSEKLIRIGEFKL
ncbi:hypothetical protein EB1_19240 [Empedobacter brevis NBRC 14943 = ATCC 43319]|uniref:Peptidoglycan peptidase n=1 Tax=Empedobacter brevis NBRC 14943 = ATCC 43319 TaxID=1218108 RepID=A0A511NH56_9FLAO|nr:YiiX/YebB-like N1pC/P60 family cysteine hydrolase [Empedobacter brevis]GEM52134.1 hypothetical protein EB1_19240 [Empedobacter brevis NBRC 14943 = ATCC 43319]